MPILVHGSVHRVALTWGFSPKIRYLQWGWTTVWFPFLHLRPWSILPWKQKQKPSLYFHGSKFTSSMKLRGNFHFQWKWKLPPIPINQLKKLSQPRPVEADIISHMRQPTFNTSTSSRRRHYFQGSKYGRSNLLPWILLPWESACGRSIDMEVRFTSMEAFLLSWKFHSNGNNMYFHGSIFHGQYLLLWFLGWGWLVGLWRFLRMTNYKSAVYGWEQGTKWEGSIAGARHQAAAEQQGTCWSIPRRLQIISMHNFHGSESKSYGGTFFSMEVDWRLHGSFWKVLWNLLFTLCKYSHTILK